MILIREINTDQALSNPSDVEKYLDEFKQEDREYVITIGLDVKNRPLYREIVSIGTLDEAMIHPREIFKKAVMCSASRIIIAHNHPSGNSEPSVEDIVSHKKLRQAGEILQIPMIDCFIITKNEIKSFNEEVN